MAVYPVGCCNDILYPTVSIVDANEFRYEYFTSDRDIEEKYKFLKVKFPGSFPYTPFSIDMLEGFISDAKDMYMDSVKRRFIMRYFEKQIDGKILADTNNLEIITAAHFHTYNILENFLSFYKSILEKNQKKRQRYRQNKKKSHQEKEEKEEFLEALHEDFKNLSKSFNQHGKSNIEE
jgi:hypothetical protein